MKPGVNPKVYVLAGPNGSGKTTFATEFLPKFVQCREFLNADLIAAGLAPFAPETQNIRAGRILLELIEDLSSRLVTFGFETTLAGRGYANLLRRLKLSGYQVCLFFLWLPDVETAIQRVKCRVEQGGHNIPEIDIRRRYVSGLRNLMKLYRPLCDEIYLLDANLFPPLSIASIVQDELQILDSVKYSALEQQSGSENKDS
jgi:predicted ABC-type ATPase